MPSGYWGSEQAQLDPAYLELKYRKSVDGSAEVRPQIERLRNHGVRFAIDDFGTGFASLNHLHMGLIQSRLIKPISIILLLTVAISDRRFTSNMASFASGHYCRGRGDGCSAEIYPPDQY